MGKRLHRLTLIHLTDVIVDFVPDNLVVEDLTRQAQLPYFSPYHSLDYLCEVANCCALLFADQEYQRIVLWLLEARLLGSQ